MSLILFVILLAVSIYTGFSYIFHKFEPKFCDAFEVRGFDYESTSITIKWISMVVTCSITIILFYGNCYTIEVGKCNLISNNVNVDRNKAYIVYDANGVIKKGVIDGEEVSYTTEEPYVIAYKRKWLFLVDDSYKYKVFLQNKK